MVGYIETRRRMEPQQLKWKTDETEGNITNQGVFLLLIIS